MKRQPLGNACLETDIGRTGHKKDGIYAQHPMAFEHFLSLLQEDLSLVLSTHSQLLLYLLAAQDSGKEQ